VHYACFKGNIPILDFLIELGGSLDALSLNGLNCLHLAVSQNHVEMVKYLIKNHEFSPNELTKSSSTSPLMLASKNGATDVVKYLIETHHVDVTFKDKNQSDALIWAIKFKRQETAARLFAT
jgi:ankyrin repeat protein